MLDEKENSNFTDLESASNLAAIEPLRASRMQRAIAVILDSGILVVSLCLITQFLPAAPPATGMALYSAQDFRNYWTLVSAAFVLTSICYAALGIGLMRAPLGHLLMGMKLVNLDGTHPSPRQVFRRWLSAMKVIALLAIPGPLIALVLGILVAGAINVAFSTTDLVLRQLGIPDSLRYALHSISFIALAWAVWLTMLRPMWRLMTSSGPYLSSLDKASSTTYFSRSPSL